MRTIKVRTPEAIAECHDLYCHICWKFVVVPDAEVVKPIQFNAPRMIQVHVKVKAKTEAAPVEVTFDMLLGRYVKPTEVQTNYTRDLKLIESVQVPQQVERAKSR